MTTLHQIHTTIVPARTYYTIKHQAVDFDLSLSHWATTIFSYVAGRPELALDIYETYMATNGHADTIPEMPAVGAGV